jgi:hypothetical protein
VRFEGDVAERWKNTSLHCQRREFLRVRHELPERRPGDSLNVEQARQIAHSVLTTKYQMDSLALKEVSAVAAKRPARQDWTFEFADS